MRLRATASLVAVAALSACGTSAQPDPVVVKSAPSAIIATDPRVGELQVLVTELLDRIEVLNARIERLETGQAVPAIPPARQSSAAKPAAVPTTPPTNPPAPASRRSTSPEELYRSAMEMYGRGQIDNARGAFQQVFDADPSGDLADNALFWIGESYYGSARYADAIAYFGRVEREYPGENKAPDAMLKLGMSHAKTGDLVLARQTFEALIERYPYSTAASAAKVELRRIAY